MVGILTLSRDPLKDIHATGTLVSMKYRADMDLTPETTDGLGVASFVESGEKVIDVVRRTAERRKHVVVQLECYFLRGHVRLSNLISAPSFRFSSAKSNATSRRLTIRFADV